MSPEGAQYQGQKEKRQVSGRVWILPCCVLCQSTQNVALLHRQKTHHSAAMRNISLLLSWKSLCFHPSLLMMPSCGFRGLIIWKCWHLTAVVPTALCTFVSERSESYNTYYRGSKYYTSENNFHLSVAFG